MQKYGRPRLTNNAIARVLAVIERSEDPEQLRRFIENAQRQGEEVVRQAAFRRLLHILPGETPGTIEHDFWRTIHAFEEVLREERGRTVRLSRTRQKVQRVGVMQTLIDFALNNAATDGFNMLIERSMPELTGEAIILRHKEEFEDEVIKAAEDRLSSAGVKVDALPIA